MVHNLLKAMWFPAPPHHARGALPRPAAQLALPDGIEMGSPAWRFKGVSAKTYVGKY